MSKLKDRIIHLLGGYTHTEWGKRCYEEDKKHEDTLVKKDEAIRDLAKLPDFTPDDCTRGTWCSECVFARIKRARVGQYPYTSYVEAYYCGKTEACKHLLIKEVTHDRA